MSAQSIRIAVIGAGPSGLFFCHAVERILMRQQLLFKGQPFSLTVTCFERSSEPGGVWRAADPYQNETATVDMYDNLWTNGASHCTEFSDYTFDEHFGHPVSVYMKRQDLLDYILGRVRKHTPDFLEKYVQLNTEVQNVVYDDVRRQFCITVEDRCTSKKDIQYFDKCVWACGENGKKNIPPALIRIFSDGGFTGRIFHSSDTANLEQDVRGKRILLVGGGFSAEDLTLQAIKLGVEKVYVSCRSMSAEICWTQNWPLGKVELLECQIPTKVTEKGSCIQFQEVEWTPSGRYEVCSEEIEEEIRDIDTVILCTGYDVNLDMLDDNLRKFGYPKSGCKISADLKVPEDWKMPQNILSKRTGEVELHEKIKYYSAYVHPNFYNGILISNPSMMFICPYASDLPLLACDTYAWLLARYATGSLELPTEAEMKQRNEAEAMMMLSTPYFRYYMDLNYCNAVNNLRNFWRDDGEYPEEWNQVEKEEWLLSIKRLAQTMQDGEYDFSLGNFSELNENGDTVIKFGDLDYEHRAKLTATSWKTFRDVDDADKFYSLHTGTKAIPLPCHWLDMDNLLEKKESLS